MSRFYDDVEFSSHPSGRPYGVCNMVATLDGKILSGTREESVMDLGSSFDHDVLRLLESKVDAVVIGAQTLRATNGIYYSNHLYKVVVTRSGNLPWESRFFTDDPARAVVAAPKESMIAVPKGVHRIDLPASGSSEVIFGELQARFSIGSILIEGGSELNAEFFRSGCIDELFLTLAPKIKLGREIPTLAGGEPLKRTELLHYELLSTNQVDNELFLRYRRRPE